MSWISDHYEKAALAGTLLAAVALGYVGLQSKSAVQTDFNSKPRGKGSNDPSVIDGDKVSLAKFSFQNDPKWTKAEVNDRPVDLFTGVPLFVKRPKTGDTSPESKKPVDLPTSPDVHPPITNKWFLEYRIDPGFGDSPQRDEDGDGFTNLEEFNANTNPTDERSHPPLIIKLVYLGDESVKWVLRPNGFPNDAEPGMNFEYSDTKCLKVKNQAAEPIKPGSLFFVEDEAKTVKNRFKYLKFVKIKQRDERVDADVEIDMIHVEDQKPNKKTTVYEIPANFRPNELNKFAKYDRTAKLSLEALGFGGQELKIEEFTDFALPKDAATKSYRLMEVSPTRVVVRETLADGTTKLHEIAKRP